MVTFTGISTWANVLIFTRTSRVKLLMVEHGGTSYDDDDDEEEEDATTTTTVMDSSQRVDPTVTSESLPCVELQVPWSNGGLGTSM